MLDIFLPKKIRTKIEALERELENYRALVANTPDLLYRTDVQGHLTFVSPSVECLSGYTVQEAIGMKIAEEIYLHQEERLLFLELLEKNGSVKNFQAQLKRKDGSVWWASTNAHFFKDQKGTILGVEGITRNVDDLKRAEEAQRKSEELFRMAFHTSPDSINLNRASDGMYIDINEGFSKLMGYEREEVVGRTSTSLNIWRNPEDREKLVKGLKEQGYVENLEAEFIDKEGNIRMPSMDGEETFTAIRQLYPHLPILLSSGYSINGQVRDILDNGCNGFIQKPFNMSEISQKLRNILDNGACEQPVPEK